jgi:ribose/xylose/arabinose/galactoside ABC-type transport system permease subunit
MELNNNCGPRESLSLSKKISSFLSDNFVWVLVVVVSFIAFLITPVFYSINNLYNLLVMSSVLGILVLGETLVLMTGNFDNSLEITMMFSAMVAAWLMVDHTYASGWLLSPFLGISLMLITGAVIGAINGIFVGYIGMQPFITTFATSVVVAGIGILTTGGSILTPYPASYTVLGRALIGPLPLSGVFVIVLYLIFHVILKYTPLGRCFYVVGGNRDAAKSLGVDVRKTQLIAFILAGVLSAIGGWILSGRLNSASSQMSTNQLLLAFGAAVIGGVRLGGGEAKISGMFGGVVLISSIYTLMNLAEVDVYFIRAMTGLVILGAMLIDAIRSGYFLKARN